MIFGRELGGRVLGVPEGFGKGWGPRVGRPESGFTPELGPLTLPGIVQSDVKFIFLLDRAKEATLPETVGFGVPKGAEKPSLGLSPWTSG